MKNKKTKQYHFADWDEFINELEISTNSNSNFQFHSFDDEEIFFDFHGFDSLKTASIIENLIFQLNSSATKCLSLISGIGMGVVREQILSNLDHYMGQFDLDLRNPGIVRVCKK
ncbi:hypothetical protein [Mycoplasma sp. 'Moose RK']|uniref:hypothetical protein n=1 Tax=Mycoplasma sp. 'Moose RK' TaxID=2780095 RepID=UPI0018C2DBA3|nr:hypothetical protein [Mycoplasma sp. 'Moose RK']MBG0730914.1 hypothetical protein [Mycoplasma sp. 'Moose RK']